jgi:hypothetical protein
VGNEISLYSNRGGGGKTCLKQSKPEPMSLIREMVASHFNDTMVGAEESSRAALNFEWGSLLPVLLHSVDFP